MTPSRPTAAPPRPRRLRTPPRPRRRGGRGGLLRADPRRRPGRHRLGRDTGPGRHRARDRGRSPTGGPDEVALGQATLGALHKRIGDHVHRAPRAGRSYRIVGRAVFPRITGQDLQPLADGTFFTGDAFRRLAAHNENVSRYLVGRFSAGRTTRGAGPGVEEPGVQRVQGSGRARPDQGARLASVPPEIERLRRVGWFAPASRSARTVREPGRRARARHRGPAPAAEFAVFKTLGSSRRQVRAAVAWHATMLAAVGLVIGIPLGLLVGRWTWRQLAHSLGVSTTAWVPAPELVIVAAIVVLIANLIGAFPARVAARTRPAVALRAE